MLVRCTRFGLGSNHRPHSHVRVDAWLISRLGQTHPRRLLLHRALGTRGNAVLPPEYRPLLSISHTSSFLLIWVRPPSYAAVLQIHSLTRILVILHRPSRGHRGLPSRTTSASSLGKHHLRDCRWVDEDGEGTNMTLLNCLAGGKGCRVPWVHRRC